MTKPKAPQPIYRLTLRALPDAVPATNRLRRLLKMLLRGYGMRCEKAEDLTNVDGVDVTMEADIGREELESNESEGI